MLNGRPLETSSVVLATLLPMKDAGKISSTYSIVIDVFCYLVDDFVI